MRITDWNTGSHFSNHRHSDQMSRDYRTKEGETENTKGARAKGARTRAPAPDCWLLSESERERAEQGKTHK